VLEGAKERDNVQEVDCNTGAREEGPGHFQVKAMYRIIPNYWCAQQGKDQRAAEKARTSLG